MLGEHTAWVVCGRGAEKEERGGGGEVHPYIVNNFWPVNPLILNRKTHSQIDTTDTTGTVYTVFVVSRLASFISTQTVSNIVTQT
jgi:hypothetical protein